MKKIIELYDADRDGWTTITREVLNVKEMFDRFEKGYVNAIISVVMNEDPDNPPIGANGKINENRFNDDAVAVILDKAQNVVTDSRIVKFVTRTKMVEKYKFHTTIACSFHPVNTGGLVMAYGKTREEAEEWCRANIQYNISEELRAALIDFKNEPTSEQELKAMNKFKELFDKVFVGLFGDTRKSVSKVSLKKTSGSIQF